MGKEIIEINGIKYAPTERAKSQSMSSSKMALFAAMAASVFMPHMDGLSLHGRHGRRLPDGINVVSEYGLIQNKRSKLSKWEREMVIGIFEANYRRV